MQCHYCCCCFIPFFNAGAVFFDFVISTQEQGYVAERMPLVQADILSTDCPKQSSVEI